MFATIALIALLASTTPEALARLDIAKPSEAAAAVASCMKAARLGDADESRLIADGWQEKSGDWGNGNVFTHPKNAAVLFTTNGLMGDGCFVRVRLADGASVEGAADEIDRLLGVDGQRRPRQPGYFLWRTGNRIVASESFYNGAAGPPYVIQIGIGELLREFR